MRSVLNAFWLANLCADGFLALIVIVLWDEYRFANHQSSVHRLQLFGRVESQHVPVMPPHAPMARPREASVTVAHSPPRLEPSMDKKAKKKTEVLNQRLQKLRQQLAGAKKQLDEPGEVARLEGEIAQTEAELKRLKEA